MVGEANGGQGRLRWEDYSMFVWGGESQGRMRGSEKSKGADASGHGGDQETGWGHRGTWTDYIRRAAKKLLCL